MARGDPLLIQLGGTAGAVAYDDPFDPPSTVTTLPLEESLVLPLFRAAIAPREFDHYVWTHWPSTRFNQDSKAYAKMPDTIRDLAQIIWEDEHDEIIGVMGTDILAENLEQLKILLGGIHKKIAVTGFMLPASMHGKYFPKYERQFFSDGLETLPFIYNHLHEQPAGVWVAGRDSKTRRLGFFDPQKVTKDWDASKKDLVYTVRDRS